ncbi:MAG: tRNA (guanosine(46)-N7)-methyltransferase TrmB, partial [Betaproteobacteria bacterium]|nr:tRNA (guanosine(46)-N7)-methyltransferase TrmB [Betaproteobacteria bacterium]
MEPLPPNAPADPDQTPPVSHRPIRSFVLRQGRLSSGQARALDTQRERFCIPYQTNLLDHAAVFGRDAPLIIEIGFGMGQTTADIAAAMPDKNMIGIEVHTPGVGSLLKQIGERSLGNLRIIQHDAVEVLEQMVAADSLAGIHIYFPDPWPKKRHHKRRLIQPAFVQVLAKRLKPGGYLHLATDWQEYAEHMLAVLQSEPLLTNTAADYAPRPSYRSMSNFERKGLNKGH